VECSSYVFYKNLCISTYFQVLPTYWVIQVVLVVEVFSHIKVVLSCLVSHLDENAPRSLVCVVLMHEEH
jgi:hypothetical protein